MIHPTDDHFRSGVWNHEWYYCIIGMSPRPDGTVLQGRCQLCGILTTFQSCSIDDLGISDSTA